MRKSTKFKKSIPDELEVLVEWDDHTQNIVPAHLLSRHHRRKNSKNDSYVLGERVKMLYNGKLIHGNIIYIDKKEFSSGLNQSNQEIVRLPSDSPLHKFRVSHHIMGNEPTIQQKDESCTSPDISSSQIKISDKIVTIDLEESSGSSDVTSVKERVTEPMESSEMSEEVLDSSLQVQELIEIKTEVESPQETSISEETLNFVISEPFTLTENLISPEIKCLTKRKLSDIDLSVQNTIESTSEQKCLKEQESSPIPIKRSNRQTSSVYINRKYEGFMLPSNKSPRSKVKSPSSIIKPCSVVIEKNIAGLINLSGSFKVSNNKKENSDSGECVDHHINPTIKCKQQLTSESISPVLLNNFITPNCDQIDNQNHQVLKTNEDSPPNMDKECVVYNNPFTEVTKTDLIKDNHNKDEQLVNSDSNSLIQTATLVPVLPSNIHEKINQKRDEAYQKIDNEPVFEVINKDVKIATETIESNDSDLFSRDQVEKTSTDIKDLNLDIHFVTSTSEQKETHQITKPPLNTERLVSTSQSNKNLTENEINIKQNKSITLNNDESDQIDCRPHSESESRIDTTLTIENINDSVQNIKNTCKSVLEKNNQKVDFPKNKSINGTENVINKPFLVPSEVYNENLKQKNAKTILNKSACNKYTVKKSIQTRKMTASSKIQLRSKRSIGNQKTLSKTSVKSGDMKMLHSRQRVTSEIALKSVADEDSNSNQLLEKQNIKNSVLDQKTLLKRSGKSVDTKMLHPRPKDTSESGLETVTEDSNTNKLLQKQNLQNLALKLKNQNVSLLLKPVTSLAQQSLSQRKISSNIKTKDLSLSEKNTKKSTGCTSVTFQNTNNNLVSPGKERNSMKRQNSLDKMLDGAPPFIQDVFRCDNMRGGFINSDLLFVLSLLPDVDDMSNEMKIKFQLKVIDIMNEVFSDPSLK